jgi:hypothetical protein
MPIRHAFALTVLAAATAACGGPMPSGTTPGTGGGSSASPSSGGSAVASPAVLPGRPYDAAALLTGMRESRRPGGVPDQLETDAIALAVSRMVWTWDGSPWDLLSIGGACGLTSCTLDVAGSRAGAHGSDLYSFEVAADGTVTLIGSDLHAYDASLDDRLDSVARAAAGDLTAGLTYVGASWLPPPDIGLYRLAYRSGGEEGAPGRDLVLDLASGQIVDTGPV